MANDLGKVLLIVNPNAQSGHGLEAGRKAADLLGAQLGEALDVVFTEAPKHAIELAAGAEAYDTVIALGGDGVIHEVGNGLMRINPENRPRLGIIPVGSGNDYARTTGISKDLPTAVGQIMNGCVRTMDVGCCNGEYFLETLSFGLDAGIALATVQLRETTSKTDTALYFQAGVDQLLHHLNTYHVQAEVDGELFALPAIMFAVQVGVTYGGGFKICPDALPDDGMFDLCYCAGPVRIPKALYIFAKAKGGKHLKYSIVHTRQAEKLHLKFDQRPPCQMDGEEHIADEYDIHICKAALNVIVAPESLPKK